MAGEEAKRPRKVRMNRIVSESRQRLWQCGSSRSKLRSDVVIGPKATRDELAAMYCGMQ